MFELVAGHAVPRRTDAFATVANGNGRVAVLDSALPLPQRTEPEGEVRDISVLMADLRGFTTFCERVTPARIAAVLNEYLTVMVDVVHGEGGIAQDFVGDGVLGVFGAPQSDPDHAWRATVGALKMQGAMRHLTARWVRDMETSLGLGVAVHSGKVFVGSVGSPAQKKYAAVGDPVNTVARLEELNRHLGTSIVLSEETRTRLGDRIDVASKGTFTVRGRTRPVTVFELVGVRE
jgi:class 3 adenylate cyclase